MADLGLSRGIVDLKPYQASWRELFNEEAQLIKDKLGYINIEHVGSTAIAGIVAKPIIDIAIRYPNKKRAEQWIWLLENIDYEYKGEEGVASRFFFVKGPQQQRTFYLHMVDGPEFDQLVKFRDALIKDKDLASEYSNLKRELALKYTNDRKAYTHSKHKFIRRVLRG